MKLASTSALASAAALALLTPAAARAQDTSKASQGPSAAPIVRPHPRPKAPAYQNSFPVIYTPTGPHAATGYSGPATAHHPTGSSVYGSYPRQNGATGATGSPTPNRPPHAATGSTGFNIYRAPHAASGATGYTARSFPVPHPATGVTGPHGTTGNHAATGYTGHPFPVPHAATGATPVTLYHAPTGTTGTQSSTGATAAKPATPAVTTPPPAPLLTLNRTTIVLDPGHGGSDNGSRLSDNLVEKDVTLALAFKLRSLLQARGFTVVMTRDADANTSDQAPAPLSLDDRAGIANHARAVVCLLLHATSAGTGVHLYHSDLAPAKGEAATLPWLTAQAAWVPQSSVLADKLSQSLTRAGLPLVSSAASVRPVDSLTCPALVVELAPKSSGDASTLTSDSYQDSVAQALAGALIFWKEQAQPPVRLNPPATATATDTSATAAATATHHATAATGTTGAHATTGVSAHPATGVTGTTAPRPRPRPVIPQPTEDRND